MSETYNKTQVKKCNTCSKEIWVYPNSVPICDDCWNNRNTKK